MDEKCTDSRHVGSSKDLAVGDSVLPFDLEETSKAAEVKNVEPLLLSGVSGPRLATVKERRKDTRLADLQLGPLAQQVVVPYCFVEFGHDASCLGDPRTDLHDLQFSVVDGNDWRCLCMLSTDVCLL